MMIRLATKRDKKQVLQLLNQLGEVINERVKFSPDNVRAHELGTVNYDEAMERRDRKVFLADDGGVIIGVATFFILTDFVNGKPFAIVDDFIVEKGRRKQGVGTALMTHIKQFAKTHEISAVKIITSRPLMKAHRFYRRQGAIFAQKVFKFDLES